MVTKKVDSVRYPKLGGKAFQGWLLGSRTGDEKPASTKPGKGSNGKFSAFLDGQPTRKEYGLLTGSCSKVLPLSRPNWVRHHGHPGALNPRLDEPVGNVTRTADDGSHAAHGAVDVDRSSVGLPEPTWPRGIAAGYVRHGQASRIRNTAERADVSCAQKKAAAASTDPAIAVGVEDAGRRFYHSVK
jgi:hypothetical protein